jgi:energy-coupling factor transport system ATP-binding protein
VAYLELSRVAFSYPRKKTTLLTGINLALEKKEITAIVGANGSGKTTLTKLMVGLLRASAGEIYLAGRSIDNYSLAEIGCRIGYVFQNPDLQLFCNTVEEEIGFGLIYRGCDPYTVRERVEFYLDYFELAACRNAFPLYLSQGEKQRLAIAAVLASEPDFLILDEPTIGLDAYRKKLLEAFLIKTALLGRGMILVSHDLAFVNKVAERVITLAEGRIVGNDGGKGDSGHEA